VNALLIDKRCCKCRAAKNETSYAGRSTPHQEHLGAQTASVLPTVKNKGIHTEKSDETPRGFNFAE
jgi:hypothetical protein